MSGSARSWGKMANLSKLFRKMEDGRKTSNIQHPTSREDPSSKLRTKREETGDRTDRPLLLNETQELALAKHLLNFGLVLEAAAEEYRPNFLCNYLYELAGYFTLFYENCPVLKAEHEQRVSRLVLCDLTARVLREGLNELGIEILSLM